MKFNRIELRDLLRMLWFFVTAIVVGSLLHWFFPVYYWWPHQGIYALADAMIVGGVVGIGLELCAEKYLLERVSDELAEKLVGRGLPFSLQSKIKEIVDTDLVRENYIKRYIISALPNGKVALDLSITFDVRNYSYSIAEYSPLIQEEIFYQPTFQYVEYGIIGEKLHVYTGHELSKLVDSDPNTSVLSFKGPKKVKIKPKRENESSVCRVQMKYSAIMPGEYSDITSFAAPTIGARIIVDKHPEDVTVVCAKEDKIYHEDAGNSWYFDYPYVTGQYLRIWWFKRSTSQTSAPGK
jgi:hypothetical protein